MLSDQYLPQSKDLLGSDVDLPVVRAVMLISFSEDMTDDALCPITITYHSTILSFDLTCHIRIQGR